MNHFRKLTFQHANLKRPVNVVAGTISHWHWSEASACTALYTIGGPIPVIETDDEITKMIEALNNNVAQPQEKKDVRTENIRQADDVRKHKARSRGGQNGKRC